MEHVVHTMGESRAPLPKKAWIDSVVVVGVGVGMGVVVLVGVVVVVVVVGVRGEVTEDNGEEAALVVVVTCSNVMFLMPSKTWIAWLSKDEWYTELSHRTVLQQRH